MGLGGDENQRRKELNNGAQEMQQIICMFIRTHIEEEGELWYTEKGEDNELTRLAAHL